MAVAYIRSPPPITVVVTAVVVVVINVGVVLPLLHGKRHFGLYIGLHRENAFLHVVNGSRT